MAKKHYLFEKIREQEQADRVRREFLKNDRPLSPREMDCEKMPAGCWLWLGLLVFAVVLVVMKLISGV